jgi:hypothetical protein
MLSDTKYDGIPKGNGISGQRSLRARLALLRRKDKGARESGMGEAGAVRSPSSALVLPMPLKVPQRTSSPACHKSLDPRVISHFPTNSVYFNHTSLLMNPGQDYIDHSIYLAIH